MCRNVGWDRPRKVKMGVDVICVRGPALGSMIIRVLAHMRSPFESTNRKPGLRLTDRTEGLPRPMILVCGTRARAGPCLSLSLFDLASGNLLYPACRGWSTSSQHFTKRESESYRPNDLYHRRRDFTHKRENLRAMDQMIYITAVGISQEGSCQTC